MVLYTTQKGNTVEAARWEHSSSDEVKKMMLGEQHVLKYLCFSLFILMMEQGSKRLGINTILFVPKGYK